MNGTSETDTETEKLKGFIVYKRLRLFIKRDRQTETETQRIYCLQVLKIFHKERQTDRDTKRARER